MKELLILTVVGIGSFTGGLLTGRWTEQDKCMEAYGKDHKACQANLRGAMRHVAKLMLKQAGCPPEIVAEVDKRPGNEPISEWKFSCFPGKY